MYSVELEISRIRSQDIEMWPDDTVDPGGECKAISNSSCTNISSSPVVKFNFQPNNDLEIKFVASRSFVSILCSMSQPQHASNDLKIFLL